MSAQVSSALVSAVCPQDVPRRSANFHPSVWGDYFLSSATHYSTEMDEKHIQRVEKLKEEVRTMIIDDHECNASELSRKLDLVDTVQRLGVSYHFDNEIDQALQQILLMDNSNECDLYTVALQFRLLRQQGHYVSCDVFNKFKDSEGKFEESLTSNVRGMLSLYEATHLRIHGEDVLEEALDFTVTHLQSVASSNSSPSLVDQISRALKQPIHKGIVRLEARRFMPIYEQDASHNETLLTFAKLDFNQLQRMHQKELSDISRWWKSLDFATKLPFARDRMVECYFWIVGVYYEPHYALARWILTKVIAMTSVIDDIYDVYGTLEELVLFTDAVERWDVAALDQLPEYMQLSYAALLDIYKEMEEKMKLEGKSYRVSYAKQAMTNLVKAYFEEAKWFHREYTPTLIEEYMSVALVTSGYIMLATTSFVGMGDIATKYVFDWLSGEPKIVTASCVIGRLTDDIVTSKFEQERGHVASAIECYMKQHDAAEQDAIKEFWKQVSDAWKDINKECLYPTAVPMPLLIRVLNLARVIEVVYKNGDGYTNAGKILKDSVSSLLVDSVPI